MRRELLILVLTLATAACSKKASSPTEETPAAPAGNAEAEVEANTTFRTLCASCHGMDGTGNGPASAQLNPKPRNYTDKAWQASVTDDQIKKTILFGGAAVGKSPAMPAQPQFKEKPAVVDALVKIVRSFGE